MKKFFHHNNWINLIPLFFLTGIVALRLFEPDLIQHERLMVFDSYQILQARLYEPVPVKIIDIDDQSLEKFGRWPWSRTLVAELLAKLANAGAVVTGFDMVFSEPDNSSVHDTLVLWKGILSDNEINKLKEKLINTPTNDQALAQVMAQTQAVLGFSFISEQNNIQPVIKSGISVAGPSPDKTLLSFQGAIKNLSLFESVAAGNGSLNITSEIDNTIRRLPLVMRLNDSYYPALAIELLRLAQGASTVIIKTQQANENGPVTIESIKVGNLIIPTDDSGNLLLYYTHETASRTIPAWRILQNKLKPDEIAGQIVIIGTSAAGLKDMRPTPLNPFASGVEIHANALEQILSENYLYRPDWLTGFEITVMTVIGLLLILFMPRFSSISVFIITTLIVILFFSISWYAFHYYHWLVDPLYPSATILLTYSIISIVNYFKSEQERDYIRNAFNHYISPNLVEKLIENSETLELGGELRDMTVFFCDIRGFTSISEQLDATQLTQFINEFLTPMTQIILNEKGTIDKYIGDCIMALWNAPLEDKDHAKNACTAALKMLEELSLFNNYLKNQAQLDNRPVIDVHIGIGINSGICCVGNMGSSMRFDYSVLGDNVNLTSRLEGQTKYYGINIVISEFTLASLKAQCHEQDFAILELDLIIVKGKHQPVRIYTVVGNAFIAHSDDFIKLAKAHRDMISNYYAQNWQAALLLLAHCRALDKFNLTEFYRVYKQRIDSFIASPPESTWNGVYVATTK